eukprot:jgi/Botrbrau1/20420/Bobra.0006s0074.1
MRVGMQSSPLTSRAAIPRRWLYRNMHLRSTWRVYQVIGSSARKLGPIGTVVSSRLIIPLELVNLHQYPRETFRAFSLVSAVAAMSGVPPLQSLGVRIMLAVTLGVALCRAAGQAGGPCGPAGSYHLSCYKGVDLAAAQQAKTQCFASWPKPSGCNVTLLEAKANVNNCPIAITYYFPSKTCRTSFKDYQQTCPQYTALGLGDSSKNVDLPNQNYSC